MKYLPAILLLFLLASCGVQQDIPALQRMDDLEYPFPTKKITLSGGIQIAYADEGTGAQTILFIHGLGSYLPAWKKNVEALRNQYRCIAIDLPGYGKSSKGKYPGSMPFYAGLIAEMIDSLGLDNLTLAGHSMGGQIAITCALAFPNKVDGLILVAPAGFETFTKGQKQWFREVITADGVRLTPVEAIKTNLAYNFYDLPEDAEFMIHDRIAMRDASDFNWYCYIIPQNVQGMVDDPVYDFLPEIKQPTLVLFGENDNLIPNRFLNGGPTRTYAEDGASRIPGARLELIPKAGHFVQFERAEQVNDLIRQFMASSN